ncbi:hypothetical protein MKZ38_003345 [Zalerion maritima]|uniref:Uncharacterized protein n=1 Tax=Zalerion maritima TaxID=339359 RepID=A0AAD5WSG9_9PEZI|nr:hypothetical protein MKZ38_003345 [Zalerion maritima]
MRDSRGLNEQQPRRCTLPNKAKSRESDLQQRLGGGADIMERAVAGLEQFVSKTDPNSNLNPTSDPAEARGEGDARETDKSRAARLAEIAAKMAGNVVRSLSNMTKSKPNCDPNHPELDGTGTADGRRSEHEEIQNTTWREMFTLMAGHIRRDVAVLVRRNPDRDAHAPIDAADAREYQDRGEEEPETPAAAKGRKVLAQVLGSTKRTAMGCGLKAGNMMYRHGGPSVYIGEYRCGGEGKGQECHKGGRVMPMISRGMGRGKRKTRLV